MNKIESMKKYSITVEKRTIAGRKVKQLRSQGIVPANIYGKKEQSVAVQTDRKEFEKVFSQAGETGIIELHIGSEVKPVLIQNIQIHPVTRHILHTDFRQVDLKEKIHAKIPLELIGQSPAVAQNTGVLLELLNEIEVEALPTELPEKISVDISGLVEVDQNIKVGSLQIPAEVTLLTDKETEVVKIGALVTKEAEQEAKADEAAAATAATESEAAEAKAEGSEKSAKEEGVKAPEEKPKAEAKKE